MKTTLTRIGLIILCMIMSSAVVSQQADYSLDSLYSKWISYDKKLIDMSMSERKNPDKKFFDSIKGKTISFNLRLHKWEHSKKFDKAKGRSVIHIYTNSIFPSKGYDMSKDLEFFGLTKVPKSFADGEPFSIELVIHQHSDRLAKSVKRGALINYQGVIKRFHGYVDFMSVEIEVTSFK